MCLSLFVIDSRMHILHRYTHTHSLSLCAIRTRDRFFHIYAQWDWPRPIYLAPPRENAPEGLFHLRVWNSKLNAADRGHLMPIITPAFPSMNSSYNVGEAQLRVMQMEFARGKLMMNNAFGQRRKKVSN